MNINIKTITWNEEKILPLWYEWYKERFPDAVFTIYDNESTDNTLNIAKELEIIIKTIGSGREFDDRLNRRLKNETIGEQLVIFGDADEFLDICEEDIRQEDYECYKDRNNSALSIIRSKGFDMFSKTEGVRNHRMDKSILWNSNTTVPNFSYGAHECYPVGLGDFNKVIWSKKVYNLLHMKYIWGEDYFVERCKQYAERLEPWNKSVGHGKEYFQDENSLRQYYRTQKEKAIRIS